MVCTTFLHSSELNVPTTNRELNEVLRDARAATGEDWQVLERIRPARRFWRFTLSPERKSYELYVYVGGCGPWQQLNFYRSKATSSINLSNTDELVIAYLYGVLAGSHSARK